MAHVYSFPMETDPRVAEVAAKLLDVLLPLGDDLRADVLTEVGAVICMDCYCPHPEGRRCRCWDDE